MRRAGLFALLALLYGCGNEPDARIGALPPQPVGDRLPESRYEAQGYRDVALYQPAGETPLVREPDLLPITLTDGDGFSVQVPGSWAGTRIFMEIDSEAREVWVDALPGDTLFLAPR